MFRRVNATSCSRGRRERKKERKKEEEEEDDDDDDDGWTVKLGSHSLWRTLRRCFGQVMI